MQTAFQQELAPLSGRAGIPPRACLQGRLPRRLTVKHESLPSETDPPWLPSNIRQRVFRPDARQAPKALSNHVAYPVHPNGLEDLNMTPQPPQSTRFESRPVNRPDVIGEPEPQINARPPPTTSLPPPCPCPTVAGMVRGLRLGSGSGIPLWDDASFLRGLCCARDERRRRAPAMNRVMPVEPHPGRGRPAKPPLGSEGYTTRMGCPKPSQRTA